MSSFDFARKLVKHGADINARATTRRSPAGGGILNMLQATPFLMAARTKDAAYMRLLAELGADPLLPNADNTTPLMAAAGIGMNSLDDGETERQLLDAVSTAIELGNDVNAVDSNGETAMHGAAYKLVPELVHFLAAKGARIEVWNQPNKKGTTPLEIAMKTKSNKSASDSPRTVAAIRELLDRAGISTATQPDR
jgi:ankyrin repeat protein